MICERKAKRWNKETRFSAVIRGLSMYVIIINWFFSTSSVMTNRFFHHVGKNYCFHWWLTSWSGFKCWTDQQDQSQSNMTGRKQVLKSFFFLVKKFRVNPVWRGIMTINQSWIGKPLILNNNNYNFELSSSSQKAFFLCIVLMTLLHTEWLSSGFLNMSVMLDIWCCFLAGLVTAGHL